MGHTVKKFDGIRGELDLDLNTELLGLKPALFWDGELARDFEETVPAFYTSVLLVEDDKMVSDYIKSLFKRVLKNQMWLRSFLSAEKAGDYIRTLKDHHLPGPDVAIVDYQLTGPADGIWLCKLLENRFPETQSILISSTPELDLKPKMEAYHINPIFMQKPLEPLNFINLLKLN